MLLVTWCSRDSSTPKFLPGEDHPHASYDPILVAFSFSDNSQLPSAHLLSNAVCGTQCSGPHCIKIQPWNVCISSNIPSIYKQEEYFTLTELSAWENSTPGFRVATFHNLMKRRERKKKKKRRRGCGELVGFLCLTDTFYWLANWMRHSEERMRWTRGAALQRRDTGARKRRFGLRKSGHFISLFKNLLGT